MFLDSKQPADEIRVNAICGDVTLDFTQAELPPSGIIEIDAWAICGHIRIIVPDGAEIEIDGTPVLGSIERKVRKEAAPNGVRKSPAASASPSDPPEPPCFHIDAHAILGAVEVTGL